jgi:hypothetical protein
MPLQRERYACQDDIAKPHTRLPTLRVKHWPESFSGSCTERCQPLYFFPFPYFLDRDDVRKKRYSRTALAVSSGTHSEPGTTCMHAWQDADIGKRRAVEVGVLALSF